MSLDWKWEGRGWLCGYEDDLFRVAVYRDGLCYRVAGDSDVSFMSIDEAKLHAAAWLQSAKFEGYDPSTEELREWYDANPKFKQAVIAARAEIFQRLRK